MPPWNFARRYVRSYAYYLASIPLLNQFINWLSLYVPFAYEFVSKIGAPDTVQLIEPEPPLTTTEPLPTPTSTVTLPPPMITLPPPPPVSSYPWDYYAPKPDHLPMCLPYEEPIIEPTAYFENVYDAIMDFDLLCLEPGHFPDCYYNINEPLIESMLEIEWKSIFAPVFGIIFLLWFVFSVFYWHVTTYPRSPLIRPTQLREPSLERRDSENSEIYEEIREAYTRQEEGVLAKVKRFVGGYIPKPPRFKNPQDFLFQLSEPINVNAPTWSSTPAGSNANTSAQQATGAVPPSNENSQAPEATNFSAPKHPSSSNLATPVTGSNATTSTQKVPPSDKSVQTSGSANVTVDTSAQQIPPSDQTVQSPETAHPNTPETPSYLASRFSNSSEETVTPHVSGVVPPSNQNVQASQPVGDASRRPAPSTPFTDSNVHPSTRQELGAVPPSDQDFRPPRSVDASKFPSLSALATPSTESNVYPSTGQVHDAAPPPSDQNFQPPEPISDAPSRPSSWSSSSTLHSSSTDSKADSLTEQVSSVVPPSDQNVQNPETVDNAPNRPFSPDWSANFPEASVHPLDRQVPEVPYKYNTQRTSEMYRQMEGDPSNYQTTPESESGMEQEELDYSVTFNDQLWRYKSWPSSGSDRQFNLHTPSSVLSKSSSRQSSPISRDQESPIPNIARGLRTFLPPSTSRSPSSRTGTSPRVSPQESPQAYLQYSASMGALNQPTSEPASPWSQLSDISSVFWEQSSWEEANLSSLPSSQVLSPAVAPATASNLASAPASTLTSASRIRTTMDPQSHQVDATLLRAYLERVQARSSEQRESPIPNVGPDQDPSQTTVPVHGSILTSAPIQDSLPVSTATQTEPPTQVPFFKFTQPRPPIQGSISAPTTTQTQPPVQTPNPVSSVPFFNFTQPQSSISEPTTAQSQPSTQTPIPVPFFNFTQPGSQSNQPISDPSAGSLPPTSYPVANSTINSPHSTHFTFDIPATRPSESQFDLIYNGPTPETAGEYEYAIAQYQRWYRAGPPDNRGRRRRQQPNNNRGGTNYNVRR